MKKFWRIPQVGQDDNSWAPLLLAQLDTGILSGRLYNSGGALYVPACKIGIDNGSYRGVSHIDAAEAISLAAGPNSNWLAIEMSVSGTGVVFTASDIAGATDPAIIPASVRAAWNGEKGGFYLTATKRLIALAWKNAGGVLLAVVNFDGQKIWASQIGLHTGTIHEQREPGKGFILPLGDWNMQVSGGGGAIQLIVNHSLDVFFRGIREFSAAIRKDDDGLITPLSWFTNGADPRLLNGGPQGDTSTYFSFAIRTGSWFDTADYDSIGFNRGWAIFHMREF